MLENKYYLTKEGYKALEQEYQRLAELRKLKTQGDEVPATWHSEEVNPEYLSFQEDLNLLETKLAEYEYVLKNAELIKGHGKKEGDVVSLGSTVTVEVEGQIDEYTIVGTLEANPMVGKISNESPVGRALLGKKPGDKVPVSSPMETIYKVKKVRFTL